MRCAPSGEQLRHFCGSMGLFEGYHMVVAGGEGGGGGGGGWVVGRNSQTNTENMGRSKPWV